jgi:hypothetical protein
MQNQKIEFYRERDFGELINTTVAFIKQNIKIILKMLLYYIVPLAIVLGVLMGLNQHATLSNTFSAGVTGTTYSGQVLILVFLFLFAMVTFTLLPALMFELFIEYKAYGPNEMSLERIRKRAFDSFGTLLGTVLVIGLIMVAIVFAIALFAMITPWLIIVFVLPFIYFVVAIYFALPIRIFEKATMGEAFSRSFYLIKGNWWWTFLLYIVVSMAVGVLGSAFIMPQYFYMIFITFTSAQGGSAELSMTVVLLTSMLTVFGQVIFNSIPFITLTFQYFNLLEQKDKPGLQERVNQILPKTADTQE